MLLKRWICYCFFLIPLLSFGQGVEGTWEGTITLERPTPKKEYKLELVIRKQGKHIVGTSYIYYNEEEAVAMDLSGRYFRDRSMRLFNYDVLYPAQAPDKDRHIRKYQLLFSRSAFSPDKIEGYWQEKNDPIFGQYRKGKVALTRKKITTKA